MIYIQCQFKKGTSYYTSWIPQEKVKRDKYYKLKIHGAWQDGWQLIKKGKIQVDDKQLTFLQDKYCNNI